MNGKSLNDMEKRTLSKEAQMQMNALRKIRTWRTVAIALSTIGVAVVYAAMGGESRNLLWGILGIGMILISISCAALLNLGLKNGNRNVEKILNVLEGKPYEV